MYSEEPTCFHHGPAGNDADSRPGTIQPDPIKPIPIKHVARCHLASASALLLSATPALTLAQESSPDPAIVDEVIVTGIHTPVTTSTGLPLTFMETPQSVTIIDQKRIQDYQLTSSKDLLDQVVGVNVDRYETERTSFT